jgi:hypothetical protein
MDVKFVAYIDPHKKGDSFIFCHNSGHRTYHDLFETAMQEMSNLVGDYMDESEFPPPGIHMWEGEMTNPEFTGPINIKGTWRSLTDDEIKSLVDKGTPF